jgi:hypothetical protein
MENCCWRYRRASRIYALRGIVLRLRVSSRWPTLTGVEIAGRRMYGSARQNAGTGGPSSRSLGGCVGHSTETRAGCQKIPRGVRCR